MTVVASVRFRITWPYSAGGYPDCHRAFAAYQQHQAVLREQVTRKVVELLGNGFTAEDLSARAFEPNGIELTLALGAAAGAQLDITCLEHATRDLSAVIKEFFQTTMPQALAGANAYVVEGEYWMRNGPVRQISTETVDAPGRTRTSLYQAPPLGAGQAVLTDREAVELLTALAKKYLRPQELMTRRSELNYNIERLLATCRFVRTVVDRPENMVLYQELGKEIQTAPVDQVVEGLRQIGMLDALDDAPRVLFANLPRSALPREDLELLLRAGVVEPEAELTLMLHSAREFAGRGGSSTEAVLMEAHSLLREHGGRMTNTSADVQAPKKRKLLNGIGNIIAGLATGGANALLAAGTIVAPNPATGYGAVVSAAAAVAYVFKGVGDLRGE